ncbi:hypothetical protein [Rhodohalobacter sp. 8-1]|uniref:hypothetical protein n=1 Tax=Rhodohalobacter sp. 8-1 TaxID=3131972 RepID=UPI0030EE5E73
MSIIQKSDLKYDYNWSTSPASKSRKFTTESESKSELFSPNEGENVLSFINEYADMHDIVTKEEALRIERLLHEKLEEENITRDEARKWLDEYLKSNQPQKSNS